jgi:hypothetical protein
MSGTDTITAATGQQINVALPVLTSPFSYGRPASIPSGINFNNGVITGSLARTATIVIPVSSSDPTRIVIVPRRTITINITQPAGPNQRPAADLASL